VSPFGPGEPSPADTPVDVAMRMLGVQEQGGPNRGPMIDEFLRFVYLNPDKGPPGGFPWCAAFVSWCCYYGNRPLRKSGSVLRLYDANHTLYADEPQVGDICIMLKQSGKGHCGFYLRTTDGEIVTVEGNTNAAGSRDGDGVHIKRRERAYWNMRFLRPRPETNGIG
jgi:hypothetical protein